MDVFDNCRICLCGINHEPIKMTRLILKFLEEYLQLTYVTKPNSYGKIKPNLCAACFNRISEFQDFLEQCKDSDVFWKIQFNELKKCFEKQITLEQTALLPLAEDSNSLEADTTVSTTDVIESKYTDHEDKNVILPTTIRIEHNEEGQNIVAVSSQIIEEEYEAKQIKDFTCIDLTNWQDVTTDDNNSPTAQPAEYENDEMIEYEYQIEQNEVVEIEDNQTLDASANADGCGVDYHSFAYEKIEVENSSGNIIIDEIIEDATEAESESAQNSFLLTSTTDENGKVKMSYKCQHCGKSFNRIYDIESHYNIHKGVKPFTCNVCGKSFRQKNILTTHQALHFGKKVECAECGKKFARRSQLILHYRMHRDEKPFVCNFDGCQAAFRQRKQLIDHSFIHTGEKNFQCATCTKSFHTRKRLQDHIYKVHSQYRYRCELCEKAFLKPHMLKHHMVTTHNVEVGDVSHLKTLVDILKPNKNKSRQASRN